MSREDVYREVDAERARQDSQWGGPANDDRNTESQWEGYLEEYSQGRGRGRGRSFRDRMIKTAALAVAAVEALDRRSGKS